MNADLVLPPGERNVAVPVAKRSIRIVWAQDSRGREPGREFFATLDPTRRERIRRIFAALQEVGIVSNDQRMKKVSGTPHWALKGDKFVRLFAHFRPGGQFVISHGFVKASWEIPKAELRQAVKILEQHDALAASRALVEKVAPRIEVDALDDRYHRPAPAPFAARTAALPRRTIENPFVWAYVHRAELYAPNSPAAI